MHDMIQKHLFVLFVSLLWVSSCSSTPSLPLLAELLPGPPAYSQPMVAFFYRDEQGARLVSHISVSSERPLPLDPPAQQVWLGGLDPPPELSIREVNGVQYGLVIAQGIWQSAGNYGPGGAWLYTIETPSLQPFNLVEVELKQLLADNRYEGQVVTTRAALLVSSSTSLLVDLIGPGGVPAANAYQIKLRNGDRDQAALARLQVSGAVRYGYVEVIGLWKRGQLEPLLISPLPQAP